MLISRLAIRDDFPAIIDMARIGYAEAFSHCGEFEAQRVRGWCDKYLATGNPTFFVADQRRDVCGFLLASLHHYRFSSSLFTCQEVLFVRPDKRGTRAAVKLVEHLCAWSDRLGAVEIIGGNDRGGHTDAVKRVLEHFGFRQSGVNMIRRSA